MSNKRNKLILGTVMFTVGAGVYALSDFLLGKWLERAERSLEKAEKAIVNCQHSNLISDGEVYHDEEPSKEYGPIPIIALDNIKHIGSNEVQEIIEKKCKIIPWLQELSYGSIFDGTKEQLKAIHESDDIPDYVAASINLLCEREGREIEDVIGKCEYNGGNYKCIVYYLKLDDSSLRTVVDWYEHGECGIARTHCLENMVNEWCKNGFESHYYGNAGEVINRCKEELNCYDWDLLERLGYKKRY